MKDDVVISTDKALLDLELIHHYLSVEAYWAKGRTFQTVKSSIDNSLCFGVYQSGEQVGFGRVVTDFAVFAWLLDVFVLGTHQGKGIGKKLIDYIMNYPELQHVNRWGLNTQDAHKLYGKYGFEELDKPSFYMERVKKK